MALFQNLERLSRSERRTTIASFVFLLVLMVAHSLMETARDALFLGALPAESLPYVYLMIVVVSVLVSRRVAPVMARVRADVALRGWLLLSATFTLGFWAFIERAGAVGYYALYVWSAVMTTLALIQFWTFLGDLLAMSSAKRVYSLIAAGASFGSIAGSGLAALLTTLVGARQILVVVAGVLAVSAIGPWLLARWNADRIRTPDPAATSEKLGVIARKSLSRPYSRGVVAFVVLATITVTLGDYVFKSTVAANVSEEHLGEFFGMAYFVFNAVGLFVQLVLVNALIRRFTLTSALGILPALMLMGGTGFLIGGGLVAAVALRGADGALRYSLHRTALELLYVPLTHKARSRLKIFNDLLAQRGAQGIASLVILGLVALGAGTQTIMVVMCTSAAGWLMFAVALRRPYLDLFRKKLDPEMLAEFEFPDLDVESLESLLAAMNDVDDRKVLATMDLLAREGLVGTIPALIVYHPSDEVVLRAIDLFTQYRREDFIPVAQRRLLDASPLVRAALIAATSEASADENTMRALVAENDHAVAVTAAVIMLQRGWGDPAELRAIVRRELEHQETTCSRAFLRAVRHGRVGGFAEELEELLRSPDPVVRRRVIAEMERTRDPRFLVHLRDAIADRAVRRPAFRALLSWGDEALTMLLDSLDDRDLPDDVRWQLPYAIGQFAARIVVPQLAANLQTEPDGMVRYRTIREFERIQQTQNDFEISAYVDMLSRDMVINVYEYADWRATLQRNADENPELVTETHTLMEYLLAGKEANAQDLLVRMIGLGLPGEDMAPILRGLRSDDSALRSSALELIEHILPAEFRAGILTLLSDQPAAIRMQDSEPIYTARRLSYSELLGLLLESGSFMLRSLAAHRIGELQLSEHAPELEAQLASTDEADYALVLTRSLEMLPGSSA